MNIKGEYANETGLEACLPCENGFIAPEEGSKVNYSHKCSFFFQYICVSVFIWGIETHSLFSLSFIFHDVYLHTHITYTSTCYTYTCCLHIHVIYIHTYLCILKRCVVAVLRGLSGSL
jgi:hypothetical protein